MGKDLAGAQMWHNPGYLEEWRQKVIKIMAIPRMTVKKARLGEGQGQMVRRQNQQCLAQPCVGTKSGEELQRLGF